MKKGEATRARLKQKAQKLAADRAQEHNRQYALQMAEATPLAGEIPKAYAEANQYMQSEAYQQAVERFLHCKKCLSALKRLSMISVTMNIDSGEIDVLVAQCYLKMEQPDNCVISAKLACLQGYSVQMEKLGVWYFRAKQFAPAFEILWAAYVHNKTLRDRDSYDYLGWLILDGFVKKEFKSKQYPLAIEILSVAENQGSLYAAYALGQLYYECEIEKYRDLKKARKCFEKAAQDGSRPESHLQLGLLLTDLQDYQAALLHYKKAIEAGLTKCYRNMGIIYDLVLDDKASAIDCYQKAIAECDDPYAMHNLGLMHQDGEGMPKNPQAALDLYERAIDRGFLDACPNVATLMMMSNTGVEKNPLKAEKYLRLAAKANNPLALHILAIYIREGKFPSQSPKEETLAFLLEAAKLGKVESMYSYSILKGAATVGFDVDVANWYKKAADLGYPPAQFNYALYLAQQQLVAMQDGGPEESRVISLILEYLEKTSESKDVSLANTALIKLKAIKALGNSKKVIVEQLSQNKPSEISSIEQEIASIKAARRRPQAKRIGRILQFFNNTSSLSTQNIATALYSIAEIFDENSSVRRPFDVHSADIAKLVNFVADHAEEFKLNELANIFIGLSKLHMHPDNAVMARCLHAILPILQVHVDVVLLFDGRTVCYAATRFLLNSQHSDAVLFCKTLYDRILNQDFTARMGLKISTESAYFVYIFHQCSNVLLPATRESLINLCEQASRFLECTSEKRIIHQWLMINRFFEQQFGEPLEFIKSTLKGSEGALLADAQSSRFEDDVADCLCRIGIRFERQRVFNGIPVDFYLPDYDHILEANGPSHYLYGIGEPVLTPRDIARNKFIPKPISTLSYLEWAHWKDLSICDDQLLSKINAESQDFPRKLLVV